MCLKSRVKLSKLAAILAKISKSLVVIRPGAGRINRNVFQRPSNSERSNPRVNSSFDPNEDSMLQAQDFFCVAEGTVRCWVVLRTQ